MATGDVATDGNNTKGIDKVNFYPTNWLNQLPDSTLKQIALLGSHNTCDQRFQDMSVLGQLKKGVRFIDLHLTLSEGKVLVVTGGERKLLQDVLNEVKKFVECNKTEKVVVYLQNAIEGAQVDWAAIKVIIQGDMKELFVPKAQSALKLKEMKGSIILIAPNDLAIEENWGTDSIICHLANEKIETYAELCGHLNGLAERELTKEKEGLVWIKASLRGVGGVGARGGGELQAVTSCIIAKSKNYNVLTFSFINKEHFEGLRTYLCP